MKFFALHGFWENKKCQFTTALWLCYDCAVGTLPTRVWEIIPLFLVILREPVGLPRAFDKTCSLPIQIIGEECALRSLIIQRLN